MKFKTRLIITFLTIILLPLVLACTAFLCIGGALIHEQEEYGFRNEDYNMLIDPTHASRLISSEIFQQAKEILREDEAGLEDIDVLSDINEKIENKSSYIIVRKNNQIYYTGNELAAKQIFDRLPEFQGEIFNQELEESVYYFSDGAEGSFFVISRMNSILSRRLFVDMAIAIMVILIFTSMFLTNWISRGVFIPINQLNIAMQNIAEGNLEYMLPEKEDGEIGELYRNYEDMRLRLKESTDEKIFAEKQNKELVSNISHDLKTPITAIKGYVEGIKIGRAHV